LNTFTVAFHNPASALHWGLVAQKGNGLALLSDANPAKSHHFEDGRRYQRLNAAFPARFSLLVASAN
jgi:hypothetical protein